MKESTFTVYGRTFKTLVFMSNNEANNFMWRNEDYGVIGVIDKEIHLAKIDDEGEYIEETN